MIEPKTKEIGGVKVTVQAWPARKAFKYQVMYGKIFKSSLKELGAALQKAKDNSKSTDTKVEIDLSELGAAFGNLFETLTEEKTEEVLVKCLSGVIIDNVPVTMEIFDTLYQGKIDDVYKVLAFVLEVNYGSFLGEGGIGALLTKS